MAYVMAAFLFSSFWRGKHSLRHARFFWDVLSSWQVLTYLSFIPTMSLTNSNMDLYHSSNWVWFEDGHRPVPYE